jgi:hypothetical protein
LCVENDVLAYPFVVDLAGVCLTRDMEGDGNEWRVQNMEAGGGTLGYFTPETLKSPNPRRSFFSLID